MSYSQTIFTDETNWLRDLKQDLKRRLLFMLSSMEQGTRKLDLSLEEAHEMAANLKSDFSEIHLFLKVCENELYERLGEGISKDWTDEDFMSDQNTLH